MPLTYYTEEEHLKTLEDFAKYARTYEELRALSAELPVREGEGQDKTDWLSRYDQVMTRRITLSDSLGSKALAIFEREVHEPGRDEFNLTTLFGKVYDLKSSQDSRTPCEVGS